MMMMMMMMMMIVPNVKFGIGDRQALASVDPKNGVINPVGQDLQLTVPI